MVIRRPFSEGFAAKSSGMGFSAKPSGVLSNLDTLTAELDALEATRKFSSDITPEKGSLKDTVTKRFINMKDDIVEEVIQGVVAADPSIKRIKGYHVLVRADYEALKTKVAVISGGGSGHEPAMGGYVGKVRCISAFGCIWKV